MNPETLLDVQNLRFAYPGQESLFSQVSFTLEPGSKTVLLGLNGAGKSTLLRLITGVMHPENGCVYWRGAPLLDMPIKKRALRMALVPQSPPQSGGFTVEEMVSLGRTPHLGWLPFETLKDRQVVEEAMRELNVLHLRGRSFAQCSGGEQERIMVARALAQEPELLLLDEPTSNQDLGHQSQLLEALERIRVTKGVAYLMVTHDWNLALSLAPNVLLLSKGALEQGEGTGFLSDERVREVFGEDVILEKLGDGRPILLPRIPPLPTEVHSPEKK